MEADSPITKKPVTDITIYGATSFVAKHVIIYMVQTSIHLPEPLRVTLAGRNSSKLQALVKEWQQKMELLRTATPQVGKDSKCIWDTHVADSQDVDGLRQMAARTHVVINCAGPFAQYSSNVVAACAEFGTDYVDITGEISWVKEMREKYGKLAEKSGARIVSLCGFDSIPSDLAVLGAVEALQKELPSTPIEQACTYHAALGTANGGTLQTMQDMPIDWKYCLFGHKIPVLMDDPLALTHPDVRKDPEMEARRKMLAKTEWLNQLPMFHSFLKGGASAPFFMAVANAKVVHASAVALSYGPNFTYKERFLPLGFRGTTQLQTFSFIPAVLTYLGILLGVFILRLPFIGPLALRLMGGAGSGPSDSMCAGGKAEVYAEVRGPVHAGTGKVDKANCFLKFKGDPGNMVTAQCVSEAALTLLLEEEEDLPKRSKDGFGTPAELLGAALLRRLRTSPVRPVQVVTHVRKKTTQSEWKMFP